MTSTPDQAIVERVLNGERRAFGDLVDKYQVVVYNAAYRILGNAADAEDATQTVFLKVYENLASYNSKYRFFSWMYRIALNESVNLRKKRRPSSELNEASAVEENTAEAELLNHDRENQIGQALMHFTPENRAIVVLKHYQEFS